MRAFTSLVGHILGSHPQVNGYFEMHLSYQDAGSVENQLNRFKETEKIKDDSKYLFDKLLHNDYSLSTRLFKPGSCKLLASLRQPENTIKSIVNLFNQKAEPHPYANIQQATDYYINRLQWLDEYFNNHGVPFFYFDAESVQQNTQELLITLGGWLQLETPLSNHYQRFNRTGLAGAGDSSKTIYSGKISALQNQYDAIAIPENLLGTAQQQYQALREKLLALAEKSTIVPQ